MFTERGNQAVYYIVRSAVIMRCTEWDVYAALQKLVEYEPEFSEATSETVLSRVFTALENANKIKDLQRLDK